MRLLIVTFGTANRESGAGQLALHLAGALRDRGHEVVSWASGEPPPSLRFWQHHPWRLRRLEAFLTAEAPFDTIDAPPIAVSARVARAARTVARSVQPDWLYFLADFGAMGPRLRRRPFATVVHLLHSLALQRAIRSGCRRAARLLLLGSQELAWVRRRRPRLAAKSTAYFAAVPPGEHEALSLPRREPRPGDLRYLWIGRWAAHKGVDTLCRFLASRIATHPRERFTLAGCGPEAKESLPEEVRRSGRVEVVPAFSRAELPDLLARHDAGLFTSRVEGWGLSLNEMLEAGLTVFATRAGAVPDLEPFFPQRLLPFPPPEEVQLALPTEDLEANGYFRHFTWPAIAERYEREVLAALPGRR